MPEAHTRGKVLSTQAASWDDNFSCCRRSGNWALRLWHIEVKIDDLIEFCYGD
jgi:hypothetical protein